MPRLVNSGQLCLATGTQRLICAAAWPVVWIKVELVAWKIKGPCFVGKADLAGRKATGECSTAISNQRFPSGSTSFTVSPEVSRGFCSLSDSQIKRAVEFDALSGGLCCPELQKPLIRFQLKWSLHCWQLSSACKLWPFLLQEECTQWGRESKGRHTEHKPKDMFQQA